ncbi:hypothetical protein BDA96_04G166300 [Sorghum bicolor]|uniref:Uncharacterized protein n=1 Tax=Sorghum bicolor TaxID=4558 RepID=A0A921R444_SORBI|nr:hypothetical protein BDA96_04G166300 [Sorghum bicolor]
MMQHLILICRLCSRQLMGIFRLARKLSQISWSKKNFKATYLLYTSWNIL